MDYRAFLCSGAAVVALSASPILAQDKVPPADASPSPSPSAALPGDDIVVTARRRAEGLIDVPVAVSAVNAADLKRNNATDLSRIGELTPSVLIASYKSNSGGTIAVRGISSSPIQFGFEQAVSVAIDGVQQSNGRLATLGFFDLTQVEVLKGPQALFFGKNSPAGVISLTSAGPTDQFEAGVKQSYEFVGDESTTEGFISGPLSDTLKARLALRYRNLQGWMYNDARAIANPFYTAAQPAGAAIMPGASDRRVGDEDVLGRLTVQWDPFDNLAVTLKGFAAHGKDQGNGNLIQNIGPCTGPSGRAYGFVDPFDDCKPNNHTSNGNPPLVVSDTSPRAPDSGINQGHYDALFTSLNAAYKTEIGTLTSTTGFSKLNAYSAAGIDYTVYNGIYVIEIPKDRSFTQEVRFLTDLSGPINLMVGAYYQSSKSSYYSDSRSRGDQGYNAALNRYSSYEKLGRLHGTTYSAFGQLIWNIQPTIEFAAGARYTHEKKLADMRNLFGVANATGNYATSGTVFATSTDKTPGILAGRFTDNNISPEATLTWHPRPGTTLYAAYKTGFKSGGFGITSALTATSVIGDYDFKSEKARGVELGAKGEFLNRRLRLTSSLFRYNFTNLQVNSYDAATIRNQISNAGAVRQFGFDGDANFRATDTLTLRAAFAYVHNRFRDFTGLCYGYAIPAAQALTAAAPANCSFVLNADGSRYRTASGTPVLQQVFDGRAPARSPELSGNFGATLDLPVSASVKLRTSADAFYSDGYYASETMASSTFQRSFWRFNASVGIGQVDDRWSLDLIGRNLTNKYYLLYGADRTGGTSIPLTVGEQRGVVARGREVALQASYKF